MPDQPPVELDYAPYAPRKSGPNWLMILLGCGCGCAVIVFVILPAVLYPVFARAREAARMTACMSNVKQLNLGVLMYSQDYDERFPLGTWMDLTSPHVRREDVFHCPSIRDPESYGYALNNQLVSAPMSRIKDTRGTPMIFESSVLMRNATSPYELRPDPPRHLDSNITGYVDGHAARVDAAGQPIRRVPN